MNKKLLMSAVFGVAALGAGAFALGNLGGGNSPSPLPTGGVAHASHDQSNYEPHIFQSEGGYFAGQSKGRVMTGENPGSTGTTATDTGVPQAPAAGGSQDTPNPDEPTENGNPSGPAGGGADDMPTDAPGQADPAPKPPIIWNPDVIDAICDVLGCDDPVMPVDPDLADGLCELLDCDDETDPIDSPIQPCKLLGNCPTIDPGKVILVDRRL